MRCRMWGVGLVLLAAMPALAGSPSGPPTQQIVRVDSSGRLKIYYQVSVCIPETQTRTVMEKIPVQKEVTEDVNGEIRKKTVTVYETVTKEIQVTVTKCVNELKVRDADPDGVKAFDVDGKEIPPKQLAMRLAEDTLVVVSSNEEMIPDYYAALFKPGTIVLSFPSEPVFAPAAVPPPAIAPEAPKVESSRPGVKPVSQAQAGEKGDEEKDQFELRVPDSAPAPVFPQTMPPNFVFASRDGAERYKLRQLTESTHEVTGHKIKRQGSGKQMVPVQMSQTVRNQQIVSIDGRHLQFYSGNGQIVPEDRIKEKLSREATVIYSADGEPVDSFWLQNFKPTTLVIVGPQLPAGCGSGPVGISAPSPVYGVPVYPAPAAPWPAPAAPLPAPPTES